MVTTFESVPVQPFEVTEYVITWGPVKVGEISPAPLTTGPDHVPPAGLNPDNCTGELLEQTERSVPATTCGAFFTVMVFVAFTVQLLLVMV